MPPVGKGDWTTTTNATGNAMMAGMLPAFPQRIKFELKEGEQTQIIGDEGSDIFLKYTIKQLKEELLTGEYYTHSPFQVILYNTG